ncbi:MAG: metal ABC transporter permease [Planctomycetota bacterium]|jgi:ABC-type Mn2+/Zn2+ transport system permease subunit
MQTFDLLFQRDYALQALVAALAIGAVCSLLSVIVVLKRMAFIGQGISHAGFGGVGAAALLGFTGAAYAWQHDAVVFAFCLGSALLIGALTRSRLVEADTAIGVLLAGTMAFGILAQNLRVHWQETWPAYREFIGATGYSPPWESILFGSLWNVGRGGMTTAIVLAVAITALCFALRRHLLFYTFDATASRVFGVRTALLHYLLMTLLAVVVVVSIRLVGLIMVSALLVLPGATALLLTRRIQFVIAASLATGALGAGFGVVMSLEVGTLSPGPCIVAVLALEFGLAYTWKKLTGVKKL